MDSKLIIPYKSKSRNKLFYFLNMREDTRIVRGSNLVDKILLKQLKLFRKNQFLEDLNVPDFLERFRKKSYADSDLSRYKVFLHYGMDYDFYDYDEGRIWGDTNYQFILMKDNLFAACLGFEFCRESILVPQIQGVSERKELLSPIKWTNALLNIAIDWTKKANIPEIWVLPSERNNWGKVKSNYYGAKLYYDVTAKKEGFFYDKEMQVFRKIL